ncbi:MAG: hypothetical protein Q4D07_06955 [Selenomonadaceae bacterium]|nr:hypothetical protein [Selenomonadaceae bacterium]
MAEKNIWWSQVGSARALIDNIVGNLLDSGVSVILTVPEDMPWENNFDEIVRERLYASAGRSPVTICCDGCETMKDFTALALDQFCKRDHRIRYRYNRPIGTFVGENPVATIHDNVVVVEGAVSGNLQWWADFVRDYTRAAEVSSQDGNGKHGTFYIKVKEGAEITPSREVVHIEYSRAISQYSRHAFYAVAAEEAGCNYHMCDYLVELLLLCCGEDVELGYICLKAYSEFLRSPYKVMTRIRKSFGRKGAENVYDNDLFEREIFKAQLKTLFPLIEEFRLDFIQRNEKIIRDSGILRDENVSDPADLELGTYYYYRDRLAVPEGLKDKLKRYREYRNRLAHLQILTNEEAETILLRK